jgi:hypothetical protein
MLEQESPAPERAILDKRRNGESETDERNTGQYIAVPMLMTLFIRTESGEEVTLALPDDIVQGLVGDHERVSYVPAVDDVDYTPADKITCEIENGATARTIIENNGIETEEE